MFGIILGFGAYFAGNTLLHIYSSDMEVIHYGLMRMRVICLTYFTCGIMDVFAGSVRGMGYSVMPMIISLIGACGLRIVWIYTIFKAHHTLTTLYISYPVTWVITICAYIVCYTICIKKMKSKL